MSEPLWIIFKQFQSSRLWIWSKNSKKSNDLHTKKNVEILLFFVQVSQTNTKSAKMICFQKIHVLKPKFVHFFLKKIRIYKNAKNNFLVVSIILTHIINVYFICRGKLIFFFAEIGFWSAHLNWTDDQIPEAVNFSGHIIVVTLIVWNNIIAGKNRRNRKICIAFP